MRMIGKSPCMGMEYSGKSCISSKSLVVSCKRFESILDTGKQEGIEEGEEIGEKRGRKEEQIEIAKNSLKMGFDIETIVKLTGLKTEDIKRLR